MSSIMRCDAISPGWCTSGPAGQQDMRIAQPVGCRNKPRQARVRHRTRRITRPHRSAPEQPNARPGLSTAHPLSPRKPLLIAKRDFDAALAQRVVAVHAARSSLDQTVGIRTMSPLALVLGHPAGPAARQPTPRPRLHPGLSPQGLPPLPAAVPHRCSGQRQALSCCPHGQPECRRARPRQRSNAAGRHAVRPQPAEKSPDQVCPVAESRPQTLALKISSRL